MVSLCLVSETNMIDLFDTKMLVIVICFTYACISPIILIFGAMYFMAALMVYKKQVLYVYTPFYESGGDLFPLVCDRTITGLICGQLTFMGYSIVSGGHILQVSQLCCFFFPFLVIILTNSILHFLPHVSTDSFSFTSHFIHILGNDLFQKSLCQTK